MGRIEHKKFVPTTAEAVSGATPMTKLEVLNALAAYKLQNPVKYEAKKAAMFARYGLDEKEEKAPVEPDANDIELAELTAKAKKVK